MIATETQMQTAMAKDFMHSNGCQIIGKPIQRRLAIDKRRLIRKIICEMKKFGLTSAEIADVCRKLPRTPGAVRQRW